MGKIQQMWILIAMAFEIAKGDDEIIHETRLCIRLGRLMQREWGTPALPNSKTISLWRYAWLWVKIVGLFLTVNSILIDTLVTLSKTGWVPSALVAPIYGLVAVPVAGFAIANLMAKLNVPMRSSCTRV